MPSGYTSKLYDGDDQTFEEFALQCARAFGALVTMRDDPMDAEIPTEFKADTKYHDEAITRALADINYYTEVDEDSLSAEQEEEVTRRTQAWWDAKRKSDTIRARYTKMLAQVEAWTPPTAEHENLKKFMREQLQEAIDFDCSVSAYTKPEDDPHFGAIYDVPPITEYREKKIERARRDLDYHEAEKQKAIERANERGAWVKALRESLR